MESNGLLGHVERRHLALACLVVLVALAGCAGGTDGGTATGTPTEGTPTENGTTLPTEASIDNFSAGEGLTGEVTPTTDLSVSTDGVTGDALAAIEGVDSYRLVGDSELRTQTNNVDQRQELSRVTRVDRERPALSVNTSVTARGRTQTQQDYYVDGTLYRHNPRFVQQYNSEWIQRNISENFTQIFEDADRLSLYRSVLRNGSVTLEGAQSIDGERSYRLRARTDGEAAAGVLGVSETNGTDAALVTTFWVDANTSTIVRAEGAVEIVTTEGGQRAAVSGTFVESLTYGDIEVTLPESASTAVEVGQDATS